jgi:hypothetical protein
MMNTQKPEILLQRYFEGDTSLEEERLLRQLFLNNEVPDHLKKYRPLFAMLTDELQHTTSHEFAVPEPAHPWYEHTWWRNTAVAAAVVLLLGVGLFIDSHLQKVSDREVITAYKKSQEAVLQASAYLSAGTREMQQVQRFNKAIEQGQPVYNITKTMTEVKHLEQIDNQMEKTKLIYKFSNYQPFKTK